MTQDGVPYRPGDVFGGSARGGQSPRVFISPQRYIQGPGVLDEIGRYVAMAGSKAVAILASRRGRASEGSRVERSLASLDIGSVFSFFGGECSLDEIEARVAELERHQIDGLIALGGGKCVDTGKAVAHRLGVPVYVVPSLASNDAPCSAVSVLYDQEGVYADIEFYPESPALVVVDSAVVASAPARYLVSGMGDAMATWFEARVVIENPLGTSSIGARPTIAASAIGEACAETLFLHGADAAAAVAENRVDESLEEVVEANTLLSGLGFESGGLAAAHGVAQSCTAIRKVHDRYLHGEMVAFGLLTQLAMEDREAEAIRVAELFSEVGLPVQLEQLSLSPNDASALETIVTGTMEFPTTANMPFTVSRDLVWSAILSADEMGRRVTGSVGDEAYQSLH